MVEKTMITKRRSRRFMRREDGGTTIEAVLWVPVFVLILSLITDASFVFYGRAQALRIVQDGNRAFSVGRIVSTSETEDFIEERLADIAPNATATTTVDAGIITSVVVIPAADLMAIGTVPGLGDNFNISVLSQHFLES